MRDIKLFISCHKESYVPNVSYLCPVQVGAAGKKHFENMLHDDEGDNISDKNARYCELTAQYWAWKNADAEYYGFFHYRRYLSFGEKYVTDEYNNAFFHYLDDETVKALGLTEENIDEVIGDSDIVAPYPLDLKRDSQIIGAKTPYYQYKCSTQHNLADYDETIKILKETYPDYAVDADTYNNGNIGFFLNMYIMKKAQFFKYCEWLFPILDKFDANHDYTYASVYESRTPGLLAERLFGIYLTHVLRTEKDIKIKYLQQAVIMNDDDPYPQPAFDENNNVICLASSDFYAPLAGVVLTSMVINSSENNNYDVFILSNGISKYNKCKLSATVAGHKNFSLRFYDADYLISGRKLKESKYINKTTYLRFGILKILRNFEKVAYLDSDIVINADVAELYATDMKNYSVAAVVDTVQAGWSKTPDNGIKKYNREELHLKREFEYFNAGVMVMNLTKIREKYTAEQLFDIAASKRWEWFDQDVFNMLFEGDTKLLPIAWNVEEHNLSGLDLPETWAPKYINEEYLAALKQPKILHFAGRWTPCFSDQTDCGGYFWRYARLSLFYEDILKIMINERCGKKAGKSVFGAFANKIKHSHLVTSLFPVGTKRREFAKKVYRKFFRRG